jgi:hypothetical protein
MLQTVAEKQLPATETTFSQTSQLDEQYQLPDKQGHRPPRLTCIITKEYGKPAAVYSTTHRHL